MNATFIHYLVSATLLRLIVSLNVQLLLSYEENDKKVRERRKQLACYLPMRLLLSNIAERAHNPASLQW